MELTVEQLVKDLRNTDGIGRNMLEERMRVAANIIELQQRAIEEARILANRLEKLAGLSTK